VDARLYERDRLVARIREWQTLLASSVKSDKPASMFGGADDFQTAIAHHADCGGPATLAHRSRP